MHKIHSTGHLSRKLAPKWAGPDIVVGLIGDPNNLKSVVILDLETLSKKTVAIDDLKNYLPPDAVSVRLSEGRSRLDEPSEGQNSTMEHDFHVDLDELSGGNGASAPGSPPGRRSSQGGERSLGFPSVSLSGLLTSSPKRVSISNEVEERFYDPGESIEQTKGNSVCNPVMAGTSEAIEVDQPTGIHREPRLNKADSADPSGTLGPAPPLPLRERASGIPRLLRTRLSSMPQTETTDESVDELVRDFVDKRSGPRSGPSR